MITRLCIVGYSLGTAATSHDGLVLLLDDADLQVVECPPAVNLRDTRVCHEYSNSGLPKTCKHTSDGALTYPHLGEELVLGGRTVAFRAEVSLALPPATALPPSAPHLPLPPSSPSVHAPTPTRSTPPAAQVRACTFPAQPVPCPISRQRMRPPLSINRVQKWLRMAVLMAGVA